MFELAIYSWKRCKRLVLNKENKGKEQICLSRTEYKIHEEVILELKQEGPEAVLSIASGQNLVSDGELVSEYALGKENVFSVFTGYGQELVILVNKRESVIAPLQKYYSSMVGRLRAGAAADNDFVIDHPLVSGHHMEISCEDGVWYLNDSSSNGTYVDGERVEKRCRLSGGEIIDLFAARIVFGITFCAVIKQKGQSLETSPKLIPFSGEGNDWGHAVAESRFFHRSPRKLKAPQMSVVAIEHPPVRQVVEKKPLFMVIGPSFTMMIPMVLGSMLAVYSYKSSGSSTGIMMYTGIITACSSALIGVVWALINMRYTNKSVLENEKRRTESYLGYIEKQRNRIHVLKEELRQSMIQMYPDTKQCLLYSVQAKELWTRNREHEDFLTERIGLGAGDISNYIEIPKERFEVVEDELNQKPYQLKKEEAILPGIPKTIDLSKEGIVGIVGTRATCERLKAAWNAPLAVPIPMIPKNPVWSEFEDLEEVRAMSDTTDLLPFAYDEKSAEIYGVDLRRTFCYLVSGKARTGKKNMLKILGSSAGMLHARRVIIEHTGNEFMQYAKSIGAEYLHTQQEQAQFFRDLLPTFAERNRVKNRMKEEGEEESTIYQQMKKYETIFVFIADLHEFMESVYQPEQDVIKIGPFVENVMEKGSLHNIYFIAAVDTKDISSMRGSRAYEAMTSYHTGIQLGGNAMEAAYFDFSHLTYTEQNKGYKAGIGMIPRDNDESGVEKVIIPQYRKRDV